MNQWTDPNKCSSWLHNFLLSNLFENMHEKADIYNSKLELIRWDIAHIAFWNVFNRIQVKKY